MALWKKILIGLAVFFVLVSIIGFLILPAVIKPIALEKLSVSLHRQVSVEKISINPYTLSVTIRGLKINEPAAAPNPFVAFDELYMNLYGVSSLFQGKLILEEVKLTKPYINIVRREGNTYNFSDLLPKDEKKPAEEAKPFYFSLNNIQIIDGSIDFQDTPNKKNHTIRNMNLAVPAISNMEHYIDNYVEPKFSANINGHPFELKGKTKPFLDSRETAFDIDFSDLDIPFYLQYVPVKMNLKLNAAKLDTKLQINFVMQKGKQMAIKIAGDLALKKVVVDSLQNEKILRLPALNCTIAEAQPLNSDIHLTRVSAKGIELVVQRNKAGEVNLLKLVETPKKEKKEEKPLKLVIDDFQLEVVSLTLTDAVPAKKTVFQIEPLRLNAKKFSTAKDAKGDVDLFLNVEKKGSVAAKGQIGIEPLSADLNLDVKNIAIRTFQPYFADLLKASVKQGSVSTAGKLSLAVKGKEPPKVKYAGKLYVSDLAVVDELYANDFLKWKQLYFESLQAGYNPFFLDIKGISLTDFFVRIIINPDGTLNLQNIVGGGEKKTAKAQAAAQADPKKKEKEKQTGKQEEIAKNIKIGTVTFQGGTIDFRDRFIKPNYSVRMLNMGGSVKGLSTEKISRATVNLKGNLGYGSPVEIKGKINPLIKDLYADVKVDFRNIELSPVTPYSSKYLGHPITKGKLTFSVEYLIEKRKLDAKNKIFFDQLTLGDKVESPDAVKAPVRLAVSLLTDRNGQINLDIPVSGSLDDPKFKVWPIIWQVIVNLITKALTAPFALLSSITGGGEELSFVEFDYGSSRVAEENLKKVDALVKALSERPQLKLDIEGYVDPENDREGLKKAAVNRKIRAQKIKETLSRAEQEKSAEEGFVSPAEYDKYLKKAYDAEKFPKPRTALGLQKKLPKEEMEKLMITNVAVTESDLRQLAIRRAQSVKELILKSGEIESARIFVVEPKTLAAEKKEKAKMSRVDFKLK
ncbi:MAG TPA: DUF748 domain-containing protein [Smithellaceae bacterium]|nr:DUF748 domain-containing protein [Smithellaceae bacterium]